MWYFWTESGDLLWTGYRYYLILKINIEGLIGIIENKNFHIGYTYPVLETCRKFYYFVGLAALYINASVDISSEIIGRSFKTITQLRLWTNDRTSLTFGTKL